MQDPTKITPAVVKGYNSATDKY